MKKIPLLTSCIYEVQIYIHLQTESLIVFKEHNVSV